MRCGGCRRRSPPESRTSPSSPASLSSDSRESPAPQRGRPGPRPCQSAGSSATQQHTTDSHWDMARASSLSVSRQLSHTATHYRLSLRHGPDLVPVSQQAAQPHSNTLQTLIETWPGPRPRQSAGSSATQQHTTDSHWDTARASSLSVSRQLSHTATHYRLSLRHGLGLVPVSQQAAQPHSNTLQTLIGTRPGPRPCQSADSSATQQHTTDSHCDMAWASSPSVSRQLSHTATHYRLSLGHGPGLVPVSQQAATHYRLSLGHGPGLVPVSQQAAQPHSNTLQTLIATWPGPRPCQSAGSSATQQHATDSHCDMAWASSPSVSRQLSHTATHYRLSLGHGPGLVPVSQQAAQSHSNTLQTLIATWPGPRPRQSAGSSATQQHTTDSHCDMARTSSLSVSRQLSHTATHYRLSLRHGLGLVPVSQQAAQPHSNTLQTLIATWPGPRPCQSAGSSATQQHTTDSHCDMAWASSPSVSRQLSHTATHYRLSLGHGPGLVPVSQQAATHYTLIGTWPGPRPGQSAGSSVTQQHTTDSHWDMARASSLSVSRQLSHTATRYRLTLGHGLGLVPVSQQTATHYRLSLGHGPGLVPVSQQAAQPHSNTLQTLTGTRPGPRPCQSADSSATQQHTTDSHWDMARASSLSVSRQLSHTATHYRLSLGHGPGLVPVSQPTAQPHSNTLQTLIGTWPGPRPCQSAGSSATQQHTTDSHWDTARASSLSVSRQLSHTATHYRLSLGHGPGLVPVSQQAAQPHSNTLQTLIATWPGPRPCQSAGSSATQQHATDSHWDMARASSLSVSRQLSHTATRYRLSLGHGPGLVPVSQQTATHYRLSLGHGAGSEQSPNVWAIVFLPCSYI